MPNNSQRRNHARSNARNTDASSQPNQSTESGQHALQPSPATQSSQSGEPSLQPSLATQSSQSGEPSLQPSPATQSRQPGQHALQPSPATQSSQPAPSLGHSSQLSPMPSVSPPTQVSPLPQPSPSHSPNMPIDNQPIQMDGEMIEHRLTLSQLASRFGTAIDLESPFNSRGLSTEQYEFHCTLYGTNYIPPPKQPSLLRQYFSHYQNIFCLMMLTAGGISFVLYALDTSESTNVVLGAILIVVAIINSTLEFYQTFKSNKLLDSFKCLVPSECMVVRDGIRSQVDANALTIGDVVIMAAGQKVPADVRILACSGDVRVDNSSITGESEPLERGTQAGAESALEAQNLLFKGTMLVSGDVVALVVRVGSRSFLGQIAKLTMEGQKRDSQLTEEINVFVRKLALIAITVALILFIYGMVIGYKPTEVFAFAVGIFIAFVPQGIPITITTMLTIAAKNLAKKNVLVKDLHGVETLGSITMLASDKTGTLTQNCMTVVGCWLGRRLYNVSFLDQDLNQRLISAAISASAPSGVPTAAPAATATSAVPSTWPNQLSVPLSSGMHEMTSVNALGIGRLAGVSVAGIGAVGVAELASAVPVSAAAAAAGTATATGMPSSGSNGLSLQQRVLLNCTALCSKATFDASSQDAPLLSERRVHGDATEAGILRFTAGRCPWQAIRARHNKVFEIPFNSTNKWHFIILEELDEQGNFLGHVAYIKGAPEKIVAFCTQVLVDESQAEQVLSGQQSTPAASASSSASASTSSSDAILSVGSTASVPSSVEPFYLSKQGLPIQAVANDFGLDFQNAYETFAKRGQRVIAFGIKRFPPDRYPRGYHFSLDTSGSASSPVSSNVNPNDGPTFSMDSFCFVGLVSLMDPPKRGVTRAIAACRTAGIQVVMVTGDHPLTAEAIARKIGIIQGRTRDEAAAALRRPLAQLSPDDYDAVVVHGEQINGLSTSDWGIIFSKREVIFARTTPQQKLEIVTRAQEKGHIVGVSGDGVNDSPALKKADLGISMNKTGSDVSKESASMILLDDNFATIVTGITEGRLIFVNMKKCLRYTVSHIMPEVIAMVLFILLGMPAPVSALLVIFIDLAAELAPSISFAYEIPEKDLMLIPPRKALIQATSETLSALEQQQQQQQQQQAGPAEESVTAHIVIADNLIGQPEQETEMTQTSGEASSPVISSSHSPPPQHSPLSGSPRSLPASPSASVFVSFQDGGTQIQGQGHGIISSPNLPRPSNNEQAEATSQGSPIPSLMSMTSLLGSALQRNLNGNGNGQDPSDPSLPFGHHHSAANKAMSPKTLALTLQQAEQQQQQQQQTSQLIIPLQQHPSQLQPIQLQASPTQSVQSDRLSLSSSLGSSRAAAAAAAQKKPNALVAFWRKYFVREETGEVLVDNELLLWVFLQSGLFEAGGCIMSYTMVMLLAGIPLGDLFFTANTYFKSGAPSLTSTSGATITASQQVVILETAQSAYFYSIIIGQMINLFICKHRYSLPIGWDLFYNVRSLVAVAIALSIGAIIVFVPGIQSALGTHAMSMLALLMPIGFGLLFFAWECARRSLRKRGYFGGNPVRNTDIVELIRTTSKMA